MSTKKCNWISRRKKEPEPELGSIMVYIPELDKIDVVKWIENYWSGSEEFSHWQKLPDRPKIRGRRIVKDYPKKICSVCATLNGGTWTPEEHIGCFHIGKCDVCCMEKEVSEPRDYGYPKFQ